MMYTRYMRTMNRLAQLYDDTNVKRLMAAFVIQ